MTQQLSPTIQEAVSAYEATRHVFDAIFKEVKELSRKKPDATMSKFKVGQVNRILMDIKTFLSSEPEAKYLDLLDDETLPQIGDAVVVMAQFEAALDGFVSRHMRYDRGKYENVWILGSNKKKPL